jgi:hypothetical protein
MAKTVLAYGQGWDGGRMGQQARQGVLTQYFATD